MLVYFQGAIGSSLVNAKNPIHGCYRNAVGTYPYIKIWVEQKAERNLDAVTALYYQQKSKFMDRGCFKSCFDVGKYRQ